MYNALYCASGNLRLHNILFNFCNRICIVHVYIFQDHGLIEREDKFSEVKTHEERINLSKNRKRLRQLRHEQSSQSKKRKILKMDDEDWEVLGGAEGVEGEESGGEADIGSTIKDLEFRLTNDLSQVQNQQNKAHSFTLKQVNVLKAILCSGLYPQVNYL